jgi:RHS repeat-associated protein
MHYKPYIKAAILMGVCFGLVEAHSQTPRPVPAAYNGNIKINYVRTWTGVKPEINPQNISTASSNQDFRMTTEYLNGLGMPIQKVGKQAATGTTGGAVDLVTAIEYDDYGREEYKYQLFGANGADGNPSISDGMFKLNPFKQQEQFMQAQYGAQGETFFYGRNKLEASPLNRVLEEYAVGNNWCGTADDPNPDLRRGIKRKIWSNTPADDVKMWTVTNGAAGAFGSYAVTGVYPAGSLFKFVTENEHGKQVIEFKTKEGKVILRKTQLTTLPDDGSGTGHAQWLCIYFIFDDLAQLRCIIQPEGVKTLLVNSWDLNYSSGILLTEQCFRYEYDDRGREIIKKVPGAGEIWLIYDSRDRVVLTQDANQRPSGKWQFTKYDYMNRPIMTGFYTNYTYTTQNSMQTYMNGLNMGLYETNNLSTYPPYTLNQSFPAVSGTDVATVTYYDDYWWVGWYGPNLGSKDNSYDAYFTMSPNNYPYPQTLTEAKSAQGLVTGIWDNTSLLTINYYDNMRRVIQSKQYNIAGGWDFTTIQYAFDGQVVQTVLRHEKLGNSPQQTHTVITKKTLDPLGRISQISKQVSSNIGGTIVTRPEYVTAKYSYNQMGQSSAKTFDPDYNSGAGRCILNSEFNIRGWMIAVNKGFAAGGGSATDYFGLEVNYEKNGIGTTVNKQHNGSIGGVVWRTIGDGVQRKYDFTYDAAGRLMKADFTQYEGSGWTNANLNFTLKMGDGLDPWLAYDANGNIKRLQQWGLKGVSSTQIDDIDYRYDQNNSGNQASNKLYKATDVYTDPASKLGDFKDGTNGGDDFSYDNNGNMVADNNKSISSITYNHMNLPQVITISGKGSIEYRYTSSGTKMKKIIHETNKPDKTIMYIGDFIYENDELQYILHEEGRIRFEKATTATCPAQQGRYFFDYFIKDHLGNTRMVLTEQSETKCYPGATVEDSRYQNEDDIYDIQNYRRIDKTITGAPQASFEAKLYRTHGGLTGEKNGLGTVLKVMVGDQVRIYVESFYTVPSGGIGGPLNMAVSDLLLSFTGSSLITGAKGSLTTSQVEGIPGNSASLQNFINRTPASNQAKAYLNWVLLDDQLKYVSSGSDPVAAGGGYRLHDFYINSPVTVTKNGYLYVFVSNESNLSVYFDNLTLTHTNGSVLEETHYYPWGLTIAGISSKTAGAVANRYEYNGKEKQHKEFSDGTGLEYYDFAARMYDVQLGRWMVNDPLAQKYPNLSPYTYCANDPVVHIDPDGKLFIFVPGLGYSTQPGYPNSPYVSAYYQMLNAFSEERGGLGAVYAMGSKGGSKEFGNRVADGGYVIWQGQKPSKNIDKDNRAQSIIRTTADNYQKTRLAGDNFDFFATSQGAVSTAQAVIAMLQDPEKHGLPKDFHIDNLILAGSPIKENSRLDKKLKDLAANGKIGNYQKIAEPTDIVNGISGDTRLEGIANAPKFIAMIVGAMIKALLKEEQTAPHVRAAENKPVKKDSGCATSDCEVKQELEKIYKEKSNQ